MTLFEQWVAFATHVRKEATRILRIWPQTLFPPLMQAGLYYFVFGTLLDRDFGLIEGQSYRAFMLSGLAMQGLISGSYANVCFSVYGQRFQRSIEELLVSPMSTHSFIWGFLLGGLFRGYVIALLTVGFGLALHHPAHVYSWSALLLLSFLGSLPLALAGFLNGLYARSFDQTSLVPTFILFPMTFLGGVFYTIDSIDPNYRWIVEYNPFYAITCGFRYAILGFAMPSYVSMLSLLGGLSLVLYLAVWICVRRGYGLRN